MCMEFITEVEHLSNVIDRFNFEGLVFKNTMYWRLNGHWSGFLTVTSKN